MREGKTDQRRDVEVLEFVARFGVVPRSAVARWAGTASTATLGGEKRLRDAGLAEVRKPWQGAEPILIATREGLGGCGCQFRLKPALFVRLKVDPPPEYLIAVAQLS